MPGLTCSVQETARLLGISRAQVYVLLKRGVLAKVPHLGRVCRIPRQSIEDLVAASTESTKGDGPVREHRPVEDSGRLTTAEAG